MRQVCEREKVWLIWAHFLRCWNVIPKLFRVASLKCVYAAHTCFGVFRERTSQFHYFYSIVSGVHVGWQKHTHVPALVATFNTHFNCHFPTVNETQVMMCNELPVNIYNALTGCCHMAQQAVDLITSNKFNFPPLVRAASECFWRPNSIQTANQATQWMSESRAEQKKYRSKDFMLRLNNTKGETL